MRILFVTPYPPSRIRVRGFEFLAQLQKQHDVTIVTQCASDQEQADIDGLRKQGYGVVVVRESRKQAALRSGLALVGSVPLQVAYARSPRFTQEVQRLCEQHAFDVVHVEHLRGMASMGPLLRGYPLVWDAVDCISLLSKQTMAAGPSLPVRLVARLEHKRTRRYEASLLHALQHVVVTSERDRQAMIELRRAFTHAPRHSGAEADAGIAVLPNGVDLDYFRPRQYPRRPLNLVFSGKMSYHANVAAALYLRQHIMPLIWEHRPEVTLTIVGSKPPKAIRDLANDPRVEVTGYVDDMRTYVGGAEVMLCPMVYSVGIQNKVLEAMALGTPVVVAAQAAEALGARAGSDVLLAGSAQEFATSVLRLLDDADLRATLSRNGRAYVEQKHDWEVAATRLVEIYRQAIHRHNGKTRVAEDALSLLPF